MPSPSAVTLPLIDDLHVHLRQGAMMGLVAPTVRGGGVGRVLVMPNLTPPITSVAMAKAYRAELQKIDSEIDYLMTLFLSPAIAPEDLRNARSEANVVGLKSYPKGVTTGSDSGVENYEIYFPIFAEMEKLGLSLHLHGELPNTCVMKAEELFLTHLSRIHGAFPNLKIVLEHVTSAAAIQAVLACGPSVAATITIHHLDLTISDVVGNNTNFCKPVAKLDSDRAAIRAIVASGNPKFFFGSDSAPHPVGDKTKACCAPAGIFTQPWIALYLADAFERLGCLDKLEDFACNFGARFLRLQHKTEPKIQLAKVPFQVPSTFGSVGGPFTVIPFRAGETLRYSFA